MPVIRVPMKVNTAKRCRHWPFRWQGKGRIPVQRLYPFPFGIGGCLADDGRNSRETVLAVRANAGLADIVIRAGDIIVTVWTSSVHW